MSINPPGSISVLDHGFVAPILQPDSDLKVVNAARVSFHKTSHWQCGCGEVPTDEPCCHQPGDYRLTDKDASLIRYLATHHHWTPFAHCRTLVPLDLSIFDEISSDLINTGGYEVDFPSSHKPIAALSVSLAHLQHESLWFPDFHNCPVSRSSFWPHLSGGVGEPLPWSVSPHLTPATLHIKLPIFVDRQLVTHKVGFVRNEVSRRYLDGDDLPVEFHTPTTWRSRPDKSIKQGSGDAIPNWHEEHKWATAIDRWEWHEAAQSVYDNLLGEGVAPEQARIVLPLSTYTEHWTTASLRSWARLFRLRSDPHAQLEIQEYAKAIDACLSAMHPEHWPRIRDTQ